MFSVYQQADAETSVLEVEIPSQLHELEASKIVETLGKYLEENTSFKTTTITKKHKSHSYKNIYDLYHDITVACSSKIVKFKMGSSDYNNVDFFYKFATEILLREAGLYGMTLGSMEDSSGVSELEELINNDFEKIGYNYTSSNGEVFSYMAEVANPKASGLASSYGYGNTNPQPATITQPVFTSSIGKSGLDPRFTLVPEPYNLTKSIPLPRNAGASSSTFESLNTTTIKIPLPTNKPTTMMDKFLFVNWYIIQAPSWLSYKGKQIRPTIQSSLIKSNSNRPFRLIDGDDEFVRSFAPAIDSKGKGVSDELKSNIWLNQIGELKIKEIRKEYLKKLGKYTEPQVKEETKAKEVEKEEEETKFKTGPPEDLEPYTSGTEVEMDKVLKWDPIEADQLLMLKENKEDLKSPKKLQKLISSEILKLNKLRQDRFVRSNVANLLPATLEERKIYHRVLKLITIAVEIYNIHPGKLPIEFSSKIPVLMTDYSGTLPALPSAKNKPTSSRLATVRGPYKKKTR